MLSHMNILRVPGWQEILCKHHFCIKYIIINEVITTFGGK